MIYRGQLEYDPNVYFTREGTMSVNMILSKGQVIEFLDRHEKMIPYIDRDVLQAGDEIIIWGEMTYPRNSRRAVIRATDLGFYDGLTPVKVGYTDE